MAAPRNARQNAMNGRCMAAMCVALRAPKPSAWTLGVTAARADLRAGVRNRMHEAAGGGLRCSSTPDGGLYISWVRRSACWASWTAAARRWLTCMPARASVMIVSSRFVSCTHAGRGSRVAPKQLIAPDELVGQQSTTETRVSRGGGSLAWDGTVGGFTAAAWLCWATGPDLIEAKIVFII